MALTETTKRNLGFEAPEFTLLDTISGEEKSLHELKGEKGTLIMFICNHCPYVIHVRHKLVEMAKNYQKQGVHFIAISSNDVTNYPEDSPEKMKELGIQLNFPFAYLFDETQSVAKDYDAACTPDFSLFDNNLKCIYRGRLDDSTPGNGKPVTGKDLDEAISNLILNRPMSESQWPSMGCNIKWK